MTQPNLIDRIVNAIPGLENSNPCHIPADPNSLLVKNIDGTTRKATWNYRSVIGMLTYLSNSTRPEIAYAIHQSARFSTDPKAMHEKAVIQLVKYCKTYKHDGIIFKPDLANGLECYVDADFAGNWYQADSNDRGTVMSRTGIYITLAGCPILWDSRLQTEIALSTIKAE